MPTYSCLAHAGRLTSEKKREIAAIIGKIHREEAKAPGFFVQVIFQEIGADSHFIADKPASSDQIWIRGDIRAGRTKEQKSRLLTRMAREVGAACNTSEENVWVYLCDIPEYNICEYGQVLPAPGHEAAWLESLPPDLRKRLLEM